jgi:NAD(P)-dependent dehydrogenase (short-subunit alcohol dehydrogenase family)
LASISNLNDQYGDNVLTLELDVTKPDQVKTVVTKAHAHFGKLDIVLNNAGYGLVGTIEEASADEVRALFYSNVFGTLLVIQAALPLMRKQGGGHILGVSSMIGLITIPIIGYYCSSKWAFEAIHESLAAEVKPFGIKVTIIEPGAYATEFASPSSMKQANILDIYADQRNQVVEQFKNRDSGDPKATPEALFQVVDAENPPLRFILGSNLSWVRAVYAERLVVWERWETVSNSAQGISVDQSK